jgi:hypothetical protein
MNLTVEIPDDVAQRLAAAGGDLSRRALEALALEEYKLGHLTHPDLRRLLGFDTHYELDGMAYSNPIPWMIWSVNAAIWNGSDFKMHATRRCRYWTN